jgi:hypothetical protein
MRATKSMIDGQVRSRHGFGRPMNVEQVSRVLAEAQSTGHQRRLEPEGP